MQNTRKLHVAIAIDSSRVPKSVRDLVIWLQHQNNIVISDLIVRSVDNPTARAPLSIRSLSWLCSRALLFAILRYESLLLRIYRGYREHLTTYNITDMVVKSKSVLLTGASGFGDDCPPQEKGLAANVTADVIIDCGSVEGASGLLNRFGVDVISPRYGNDTTASQDLPGFWECYRRKDYTEFAVEKLRAEDRRSEVIRRGTFPTQFFFSLNRLHLYAKSYEQVGNVIKTLSDAGTLTPLPIQPKSYPTRLYIVLGWHQAALYLGKISYRSLKKMIMRMLRIRQVWSVSIIQENWAKAAYWRSLPLQPPRGRYWADPFLYKTGNKTFCFVEEYVFKKKRGHIAAFEIRDGSAAAAPVPVLVEDFHLSFPFVFEYDGGMFMCPESSEAREVRVYRCVELPLKWELEKVVLRDISAADTMIFQRHGKWWMLTNIDKSGIGDYCTDLYLFYAESPLASSWTSHAQNPIKVDSQGGRNAGLIVEQDRIFRVGQRQGFDQYGEGISIYEIKLLNEDVYEEALVSDIDADFRDGLLGVHHLSSSKGTTTIDHVQWRFVW